MSKRQHISTSEKKTTYSKNYNAVDIGCLVTVESQIHILNFKFPVGPSLVKHTGYDIHVADA